MSESLEQIAKEMKEKAASSPFNLMQMVRRMQRGKFEPPFEYQRQFEFEGYDLRVTLTYDILQLQEGWHVSIGSNGSGLEIPDRICQGLLPYFLPGKRAPVEIPSMHGKAVRQFVELTNG